MHTWLLPVVVAIAAAAIAYLVYSNKLNAAQAKIAEDRSEAERLKQNAVEEIEAERRELKLAAKEEALKLREQVESELKSQRDELDKTKRRLEEREDRIERLGTEMDNRARNLRTREQEIEVHAEQARQLVEEQERELQRVSGLTRQQAKETLLAEVEQEITQDANQLVRQKIAKAEEEADRKANEIIAWAIQRCAVDHTAESTVSVVPLPSDDMKGRIIGREGRNIRAFEQATGVDLIVDDTPEAVVLSGFDPVRREVARMSLESLISDGRIHPGRIEESVARAREEIEEKMKIAGEQATFETGVSGLHPELVRLLGKLHFRTSYGQNVLKHSIEVAHLVGAMAGECGARVAIARRAGLLHDIGKAVDFERDGSHALIGMEICRSRQEPEAVVHAVAAHHEEIPMESIEAFLVQAADAISAARPGARRETLESYLKRLEGLEGIAKSFTGVDKCYAIQAGRELRVMVKPDQVDDQTAHKLAKQMAERIQSEMEYPGQIRVTVIREKRAVEYAQ
ncbi:MAG: ribonuclease Y [candidate division WS1 bacterium]|jgi:ribonuclease Y|nr:ribonuclease Y [candidate division WS1 bacterium]